MEKNVLRKIPSIQKISERYQLSEKKCTNHGNEKM